MGGSTLFAVVVMIRAASSRAAWFPSTVHPLIAKAIVTPRATANGSRERVTCATLANYASCGTQSPVARYWTFFAIETAWSANRSW